MRGKAYKEKKRLCIQAFLFFHRYLRSFSTVILSEAKDPFAARRNQGSLREGAVERSEAEGVPGSDNKQRNKIYSCFVL